MWLLLKGLVSGIAIGSRILIPQGLLGQLLWIVALNAAIGSHIIGLRQFLITSLVMLDATTSIVRKILVAWCTA